MTPADLHALGQTIQGAAKALPPWLSYSLSALGGAEGCSILVHGGLEALRGVVGDPELIRETPMTEPGWRRWVATWRGVELVTLVYDGGQPDQRAA